MLNYHKCRQLLCVRVADKQKCRTRCNDWLLHFIALDGNPLAGTVRVGTSLCLIGGGLCGVTTLLGVCKVPTIISECPRWARMALKNYSDNEAVRCRGDRTWYPQVALIVIYISLGFRVTSLSKKTTAGCHFFLSMCMQICPNCTPTCSVALLFLYN